MDNSDDYFQDSFDLDEDDLALLAAEEAKHAESISQVRARTSDSLPPQKRQKTSHRHLSEDILDVFLQPDGTYGVAAVMRQEDGEGDAPVPRNLLATESQATARRIQPNTLPDARSSQSLRRQSSLRTSNVRTSCTQPGRPVTPKIPYIPSKPAIQHPQPSSKELLSVPSCRIGMEVDLTRTTQSNFQYQEELAALKATVEMLRLENDKVKGALQDAEVVRFAREGEVSILRKKVEKAAQQHAEDLTKLKETREAASIEQARVEKEMKEQVERVRTEYIFKQHEVESSSRKTTWSSRSKRTALGSQPSPVPLPSAMRDWTSFNVAGPSRNNLALDTPSRRRPNITERQNQTNFPRIVAKSRPTVSELKFPGFENSFLPSSPLNSPSRSCPSAVVKRSTSSIRTPQKGEKGKGKEMALGLGRNSILSPVKLPKLTLRTAAEPVFDELQMDDSIQDFDGDVEMNDGSPRRRSKSLRVESSPNLEQGGLESVVDLDFSDEIDRGIPSGECAFDGIDWSEELHYMLFSHVCTVSKTHTFHFLLSVNIPDQNYQQSCSAILEVLGTKYKYATLQELMEAVAEKIISMALILWESGNYRHLRALFELLSSTMAYIPSFTRAVLQAGLDEQNATHKLLRVFCHIALEGPSMKEPTDDEEQSFSLLIHSMLALLETIAWTIPDVLCSCLVPLLQTDRVLLNLLDNKQPSSVVSHTINTLVLLASHPSLYQALLSFPNRELHKRLSKTGSPDPSRVPLIERLSGFLVDPGPLLNSKVDGDLSSILNFFALLVAANPEGRPALLKSNMLIPCLIHYLARLSTLLWEDDEQVMQSFDCAKSAVHNIKHSLCLLHRLVTPTSIVQDQNVADFDFRQKLFYAPHTTFNGLAHMFVVVVGRLSYADPPDWLDTELQAEIEKLTEPARDLMDLLIEGPEGDSVWVAYQDAEGESVTEDDDEIEARLLDADEHD